MIHLSSRPDGYDIQLEGDLTLEQVQVLSIQLQNELAGGEDAFVLVLDARTFRHFHADAQALFEEMLDVCRKKGLHRICVLALSTAFATLFCDIMVRAELMDQYLYMDIAYEPDWHAELESFLSPPP